VAERPDIALVSLGTTPGLRAADAALADALRGEGALVQVVPVRIGRAAAALRRHATATDAVEALAARRAARGLDARAFIYSTVTSALLQQPPARYAVRFDAPAAVNRPGPAGAWQRRRERTVLARAQVLLPWGEAGEAAARSILAGREDAPPLVPVPPPIARTGRAPEREPSAVAYGGGPHKRGLDLLCTAWAVADTGDRTLLVGGIDAPTARAFLRGAGVAEPARVEWAGHLEHAEWLATLGRARLFVHAARREDFGIAAMEALAAGTPLATVASPGGYEALGLARRLAPHLVAGEPTPAALALAIEAGLALRDGERAAYAARAEDLLQRYSVEVARTALRERVLPLLGIDR
jgi:glycosyltransferase involved in cell wall biosynthesis